PAPARLFQALIAGVAKGEALRQRDCDALRWLECLDQSPIIAVPVVRRGSGFANYVPNNDLDAVGGDPRRIAEIRAPKLSRPLLFDARVLLLYAWRFEHGDGQARTICEIAEQLYQLGCGVDMAWAWGEIIDEAKFEERLHQHGGVLYQPAQGGEGPAL